MFLEHLNQVNFDIRKIFAMNQHWTDAQCFTMSRPRPTNALLFFSGSSAILTLSGRKEPILLKNGSLCLLRKGQTYTWTFYNNSDTAISTMLFEFLLYDEKNENIDLDDDTKIMDNTYAGICRQLFHELILEYSRPQPAFPRIKASAYSLLAACADVLRRNSVAQQRFHCIYKGIQYLEEDPAQEKSMEEIAKMCGVSINYFERLFKEAFGITPTVYRLKMKILRAKKMLDANLFSIAQIAEELNFSDDAYFCRCFKKVVGITPNQYRQKNK